MNLQDCKTMSEVLSFHAKHKPDVIFLHEVVPGSADRSYGIHVAKIAGVPNDINKIIPVKLI